MDSHIGDKNLVGNAGGINAEVVKKLHAEVVWHRCRAAQHAQRLGRQLWHRAHAGRLTRNVRHVLVQPISGAHVHSSQNVFLVFLRKQKSYRVKAEFNYAPPATVRVWLDSLVADSGSRGCGYESCQLHCRVQLWTSRLPVTKQYHLVTVEGWWRSKARKVTVGLTSHWPCVTDFVVHTICRLKGLRLGNELPRIYGPIDCGRFNFTYRQTQFR